MIMLAKSGLHVKDALKNHSPISPAEKAAVPHRRPFQTTSSEGAV